MNIIDYLHWRGDLSFEQDPFNEIDNTILAYFSYVEFTTEIPKAEKVSIEQACERFLQLHTMEEIKANKSLISMAPIVMIEMAKTKRFKNLFVHNFVNKISDENDEQFSGMHIDLDRKTTYIAIRGTDDTMVGWKEDFQLSYKIVQAQKETLDYLNSTIKAVKKYYLGGHSKGGCLALYGAAFLKPRQQKQLIAIYNNDGPHLYDLFINPSVLEPIKDKVLCIVPEFSVFGQIFNQHTLKQMVIDSKDTLIMQHDPMGWQLLGNHFIQKEALSEGAQIISDAINDFLNDTTVEQRETFVEDFFNSIQNQGITLMSDYATDGLSSFIKTIKSISSLNESTKEVGIKLTNIFKQATSEEVNRLSMSASEYFNDKVSDLSNALSSAKNEIKTKIEEVPENINNLIKEKAEDINELIDQKKDELKHLFTTKQNEEE